MVCEQELLTALRTVNIPDVNKRKTSSISKDGRVITYKSKDGRIHEAIPMHRKNISNESEPCKTGVFGITAGPRSKWKTGPSFLTKKYPDVYKLIQDYIAERVPWFEYDSVTVNENVQCKRHIDGKNSSLTLITSIGNFTGGELCLEHPESKKQYVFNTHYKWILYDGSTFPHWNTPIHGRKYSLVFYSRWTKTGIEQKNTIVHVLTHARTRLLEPHVINTTPKEIKCAFSRGTRTKQHQRRKNDTKKKR